MDNDAVSDMIAKRRDRAIATILRVKETECDQFLPVDASKRLRKVVLDEMNDFHVMVTDLFSSFDNGVVMNDLWLQKIEELHSHLLGPTR